MKFVALTSIFFICITAIAQEEFLKNSPGINVAVKHNSIPNDDNITSFNFSAVLGYGLSINILGNAYKSEFYPTLGLTYIAMHRDKENYLTPIFNLAFSNADEFSVFTSQLGIMQCIHAHSDFPLSVRGELSYRVTNSDIDPAMSKNATVVGLGYNQAFFTNNDMYPTLGFGASVDLSNNDDNRSSNIMYLFTLGFNMNLGE